MASPIGSNKSSPFVLSVGSPPSSANVQNKETQRKLAMEAAQKRLLGRDDFARDEEVVYSPRSSSSSSSSPLNERVNVEVEEKPSSAKIKSRGLSIFGKKSKDEESSSSSKESLKSPKESPKSSKKMPKPKKPDQVKTSGSSPDISKNLVDELKTRLSSSPTVSPGPKPSESASPPSSVRMETPPRLRTPSPKEELLSDEEPEEDERILTDTFTIRVDGDDKLLATEKAERADTVIIFIAGFVTKIAKLEAKILKLSEKPEENSQKIKNFQSLLEKAKGDLERYAEYLEEGDTHATTNMARLAFDTLGIDIAKEKMAPLLCNLRMHTVTNMEGKVVSAITRSGALTDFTHGEVSLLELKDLEDLQELLGGKNNPELKQFSKISQEREDQLRKFYIQEGDDLETVVITIKAKALIGYGQESLLDEFINELHAVIKSIIESKRTIEKKITKLDSLGKELLLNAVFIPKKVKEIIEKRKEKLFLLMLQDLQMHLKTTPVDSGETLYGRISLLDLQKPSHNENGCVFNERTQGLDMKALFEELEGEKIVFDGKENESAYVDEEGIIHMPEDCAKKGIKETQLKTFFFNVCAQGEGSHVRNEGMQQVINEEMIKKFKAIFGAEAFVEVELLFEKLSESSKNDPNKVVRELIRLFQKFNARLGVNCFGGKDRTGYAVALLTQGWLRAIAMERFPNLDSTILKEEYEKWGLELITEGDSIASWIAEENTGDKALKVSRSGLSMYAGFKGKIKRGKQLIAVATSVVSQKARGRKYSVNKETKGTVYSPKSSRVTESSSSSSTGN